MVEFTRGPIPRKGSKVVRSNTNHRPTPTVEPSNPHDPCDLKYIMIDGRKVQRLDNSSRSVYPLSRDWVLKVQINGEQNEKEQRLYNKAPPEVKAYLPVTYGYNEIDVPRRWGGHDQLNYLIQERLHGDEPNWSTPELSTARSTIQQYYCMYDDGSHQWRWTDDGPDRQLKCHDSALWEEGPDYSDDYDSSPCPPSYTTSERW